MGTQPAASTPILSGRVSPVVLPSCSLSVDDLRRLFNILKAKADEAAKIHLATMAQRPGQTPQDFERERKVVGESLEMAVKVSAPSGHWVGGTQTDVLAADKLPATIAGIEFFSGLFYRKRFGNDPDNYFTLTLDLSRTSLLDFSSLSLQPDANRSGMTIAGTNLTWVNGLHDEVMRFFEERERSGFIHSRYAYDAVVIPIGFPLSFFVVLLLDQFIRPYLRISDALLVALYVYFVLVSLLVFRIGFNYCKWLFPKVELQGWEPRSLRTHRAIFSFLLVGVGSLVWDGVLRLTGSSLYQFLRSNLR